MKYFIILSVLFLLCYAPSAAQTSNDTANALTADALSANPANCSAGQAPLGIAANGAVESCTAYLTAVPDRGIGHLYERDLDGTPANSIAVTTGGTYYGWTTATAGVAEGGVTLDTADATADSITIDDAGTYIVLWDISASGSANTTFICCVHVDDANPSPSSCGVRKIGAGGDVGDFDSSATVLSLSTSDELDLRCTTLTGEDSKTLSLWSVDLLVKEVNI